MVRGDRDKHAKPVFQDHGNGPISLYPPSGLWDPYEQFGGFEKYLVLQASSPAGPGLQRDEGYQRQYLMSNFQPPKFPNNAEEESFLWYKDPSVLFVTDEIMERWN